MELVEGETIEKWVHQKGLDRLLDRAGPRPANHVRSDCHRHRQLVYRDVKPSNVMLRQQAHSAIVAKLIDFGLVSRHHD